MKKLQILTALTRLALLLRKVNILFFSTVRLFQLNSAGSSCNGAPDTDCFDEPPSSDIPPPSECSEDAPGSDCLDTSDLAPDHGNSASQFFTTPVANSTMYSGYIPPVLKLRKRGDGWGIFNTSVLSNSGQFFSWYCSVF